MMISEFGIRARIEGWSNRGGAPAFVPGGDGADDQLQRGQRYGSQIDQFISFREVVGANWHAWSDRFNDNNERLQINLGLMQCSDAGRGMEAGRRWTPTDARIADTNRTIIQRIVDKTGA